MSKQKQPDSFWFSKHILYNYDLRNCSSSASNLYSKILCLMFEYGEKGTIPLKPRFNPDMISPDQTADVRRLLSVQLSVCLGITEIEVIDALLELLNEGLLFIEGYSLIQKEIAKEHELSIKRSEYGRMGALKTNAILKSKKNSISYARTDGGIPLHITSKTNHHG